MTWRFSDPPNVAVFTTRAILSGQDWIGLVLHDEADGAWQFLGMASGADPTNVAIVSLQQILALDGSMVELADLPLGWRACRKSRDAAWERFKSP